MATSQTNSKLSVAHKLEKALEFKEIGNSFYKESNFKNAAKNYHKAILYLKVSFMVSHSTSVYDISWILKVSDCRRSNVILILIERASYPYQLRAEQDCIMHDDLHGS